MVRELNPDIVVPAEGLTMYATRVFVEAGGLMACGPNNADLFRRAGDYVDKILRGANTESLKT
jgi:putative ABC transport system substrate-binding protein